MHELHADLIELDEEAERPAWERKPGSYRRIGSMAAAKTMFAVRSYAVTAWDARIALALYRSRDADAFARHPTGSRAIAQALASE